MLDLFESLDPPVTINVKVTPKAKSEKIKKEYKEDGSVVYKVYVTAAPEDGKANKDVIKLLSKVFGIAKSDICIIHGITSREKVVKLR